MLDLWSTTSGLHGFWREISCLSYWGSFVCDKFFLLLSKFLVFQQFDFDESSDSFVWAYPTCSLLSFLDVWINGFLQIWGVWGYYFLKYSFCPSPSAFLLGPCYIYVVMLEDVLQASEALFIFLYFFNLFFLFVCLFFSDWIISLALSSSSLILSSVFSDMLLGPSSEFLIFIIVLINSTISVWFFFFITSVSLFIFFIWWDIILIFSFNSSDMVSFRSLNIF